MKKVISLFLVMLLSSATIFAQETKDESKSGNSKTMYERMISELKLDAKQAEEFRKINEDFRAEMQRERGDLKEDRKAQFEKMKTLREDRDKKLKSVLTEEQFKQFQEKQKSMRKGPRGDKPGNE